MKSYNVFEYIRGQRQAYTQRSIPLFDGYEYSQYDTLNQIDHYWLDSYVEEASDSVIGEFPFDNISKYRVLLEARATDFDRKHFDVAANDGSPEARVSAMVATKALQKHMKDIRFGRTINEICFLRAKYGGALAEKSGDDIEVNEWQNMITDQSAIMAGIRIKTYYLSPSEMMDVKGWSNVKDALKTAESFRSKDPAQNEGDEAETQGDLIEVFDIQGDVSLAMLKAAQALRDGDSYQATAEDEYEYAEVRIVVCGTDWVEKKDSKFEEHGIVLYAEKETNKQKYLARNPIPGRGLGEGVVEQLFEHQRRHNFSITEEQRMMAVASKKLYITDDPDVLSNIFDAAVDHGTVLRVSNQKYFKELNQMPTGTPLYASQRGEIHQSADRSTSSFSAIIGEEAKAGTPFRAQYLQNVEASSQFEQYREEIGDFLVEIAEEWLLPDALKKAADDDSIYETFSLQELSLIDEVIVNKAVMEATIKATLEGQVVSPIDVETLSGEARRGLRGMGNKRKIEAIQDFIKKAGKKVTIHADDEARSKAVLFESYANLLKVLAPEDPRRNALIDKIMEAVGVTREELEIYSDQQLLSNANPQVDPTALKAEGLPRGQAALATV